MKDFLKLDVARIREASLMLFKIFMFETPHHTTHTTPHHTTPHTGAVAGIADQPLQTFVGGTDEDESSVAKATGVVLGLGKGLIGVIAKPIGGAAELVSLTSMGLMRGTGLVEMHKQKHFAGWNTEGKGKMVESGFDSALNRIFLYGYCCHYFSNISSLLHEFPA